MPPINKSLNDDNITEYFNAYTNRIFNNGFFTGFVTGMFSSVILFSIFRK